MGNKVHVHIRGRKHHFDNIWNYTDSKLWYIKNDKKICYDMFSSVYMEETTEQIYKEKIENVILRFIEGRNATLFAYGQTGSGKTYTMFGSSGSNSESELNSPRYTKNNEHEGIVQKSLRTILPREIVIAYMEIYNEKIYDLKTRKEVGIYYMDKEIIFSNLTKKRLNTFEDAISFLTECGANRNTKETEFNSGSSRSHAVIQIECGEHILNIIDLAGSEKSSSSELRRKEGSFINRSLLALSRMVIGLLNGEYIGYRDSKLTRILQPSVNENTEMVALCMISPYMKCIDESITTLKFAARLNSLDLKSQEYSLQSKMTNSVSNMCGVILENAVKSYVAEDITGKCKCKKSICEYSEDTDDEGRTRILNIYRHRIDTLESMVLNQLEQHPNRLQSDIFVLEKQMFNMERQIAKVNSTDLGGDFKFSDELNEDLKIDFQNMDMCNVH